MPALQRLEWAKALMDARGLYGASWQTDQDEFKAYKSAQGYRDRLLGRRSGGLDNIDPFTPLATMSDLSAYLDSLDGASEIERRQSAIHARFLADRLYAKSPPLQSKAAMNARFGIYDKLIQIGLGNQSQTLAQMYSDLSTGNQAIQDMAPEVALAYQEYEKSQEQVRELLEQYEHERRANLKLYADARNNLVRMQAIGTASQDEIEQAKREVERLWEAMSPNRVNEARERIKGWAEAPLRAWGERLIQRTLDESPVSQEQAEAWAASIEIDRSLKAKLSKMGYPSDRFRADIAEFYRLVGGRVKKIRFNANRGQRAFATNSKAIDAGEVAVTSHFSKGTLWHEMAHHLESDPVASAAAHAFLAERRTSDKTVSLRKLTGNSGYSPDERAWEDHFIVPYVGKHYDHGTTEVFSMGVEQFADPLKLALAIAQDPHHMKLITGYMSLPSSPAFKAVKAMVEMEENAKAELKESKQATEDTYLDIIDRHVKLEEAPEEAYFQDSWIVKTYSLQKYLGRLGPFSVYKSKARYVDGTSRIKPCIRLMRLTEDSPGRTHFDYSNHPNDIRLAKAAYAKSQQEGVDLRTRHFTIPELKAIAESLEASNA